MSMMDSSIKAEQLIKEARKAARRGDFARAEPLYLEAWQQVDQTNDPAIKADISHRIADGFRKHGRLQQAELFARRAVEFEEKTGRIVLLGNHLMFLADLLSSTGRYEEALPYAERGLACYQEAYGKDHNEVSYISGVVQNLRQKVGSE